MNISLIPRIVAAVALTVGFAYPAIAQDSASTEPVSVAILADRYVFGQQIFSNLDALEARVRPMRPREIRLDACEYVSARQVLEAAYRFRDFYLEMRPLTSGHSVCVAQTHTGQARVPNDDKAVDQYWRGLMP